MPRYNQKKESSTRKDGFRLEEQQHLGSLLERNRSQARSLELSLSEELGRDNFDSRVTLRSSKENKKMLKDKQKLRVVVCNEALDKMNDLSPVMKDLIMEARSEYERFIDVLSQGQLQFDYIHGETQRLKTDPKSLIMLQERKDELERRIAIVEENNKRIEDQVEQMKKKNEYKSNPEVIKEMNKAGKALVAVGSSDTTKAPFKNHAVLRKLPLSSAIDLGKLVRYSSQLQGKINKLTQSLRDNYILKSKFVQLQEERVKKETAQHHLMLHNARLRERHEKLRLAAEKLRDGGEPVFAKLSTMFGLVTKAIEDHRKDSPDQASIQNYANTGVLEDDDPARKREAERLVEYMDTFNDMMNATEYENAAKHAANSPKAILRTYDIMKMFKEVRIDDENSRTPAMMFCHALMTTADISEKMSGALSCEVIKTALAAKRLDLVSYWLTKNCFTYSLPMANQLKDYCECKGTCSCGSLNLAKEIYQALGAHRQASLCLLFTGKVHQLVKYGENHAFTVDDYVALCKNFPSTKLLLFLMSAHPDDKIPGLISFPIAMDILVDSKSTTVFKEILQHVYEHGLLHIDRKQKSFTELVFAETIKDNMSRRKWDKVVQFCTDNSLDEIALELLSVLTIREAIDTAAYKYLLDYIS